MRVGIICRMDNTGLGTQTWEAARHLNPFKILLVDYSAYKHLREYPERYAGYPGIMRVKSVPTFQEVEQFLDDLDLVFICETPYSFHVLERARERGVKTLLQPNYEFAPWLKKTMWPRPDVFGVPTKWHYDDFPEPKILLPVPIVYDRLARMTAPGARAKKFMHVVGQPAANDRNGTQTLVEALKYVKSHIQVEIFCQKAGYVETLLAPKTTPRNVTVLVNRMQHDSYWHMYQGQDVLIMPRRYGGLCLPVNEAIGSHMPVLMPDISPNNTWLPGEWLVHAEKSFDFTPGRFGNKIEVYKADPELLAEKIDAMATDDSLFTRSVELAAGIARANSWQSLSKLYEDTFTTMLKA